MVLTLAFARVFFSLCPAVDTVRRNTRSFHVLLFGKGWPVAKKLVDGIQVVAVKKKPGTQLLLLKFKPAEGKCFWDVMPANEYRQKVSFERS